MAVQYHVYANSGRGDPIDYQHPVDTTAMTTFTSWGLRFPGIWKFAVRAFDVLTGLEEQNLDAQVTITLGADGSDVSSIPDPPVGLLVLAVAGGKIRVEWGYPTIHGGNPTGFHVYLGSGGSPNYAAPAGTVTALDGIFPRYSTLITGLTTGITYSVGVRAFNSAGEEANTRFVNVLLKGSAPRAVVNLTATATATG